MRGFGSIIVGFEYNIKKLPGTITDLYTGYKFFHETTRVDSINVITDINKSPNTNFLLASVMEGGFVDDKIVNFIENLKLLKIHKLTNTLIEFWNYIKEYLENNPVKFLTFYYTGHGVNNNIILPSGEYCNIKEIEDFVCNKLPGIEILFVLDCCSMKIEAPYYVNSCIESFEIQKISDRRCIYIVSSESHQDESLSTNIGSPFTRKIFEILRKDTKLCNIIKMYNQYNKDKRINISVYKTILDDKIWEWVTGSRSRVIGFLDAVILIDLNLLKFDTYEYYI